MRHSIDKSVTIMLPNTFCGDGHLRVIHSRNQLIDSNGTLWIKIESYGESHDIYAKLLPVIEAKYAIQ